MDNIEIEKNETLTDEEIALNDPMENPGIIKKAREHGSAQRVYFIPREYATESN